MHDAGVQFHDTLFVGQGAVTHAVLIGIEFGDVDSGDHCIQRVSATQQHLHGLLACHQAVETRNDNGLPALCI